MIIKLISFFIIFLVVGYWFYLVLSISKWLKK